MQAWSDKYVSENSFKLDALFIHCFLRNKTCKTLTLKSYPEGIP